MHSSSQNDGTDGLQNLKTNFENENFFKLNSQFDGNDLQIKNLLKMLLTNNSTFNKFIVDINVYLNRLHDSLKLIQGWFASRVNIKILSTLNLITSNLQGCLAAMSENIVNFKSQSADNSNLNVNEMKGLNYKESRCDHLKYQFEHSASVNYSKKM